MRKAVMKETAMRLRVGLEYRKEEPVKISLLINSIYYFIESVFIMELREGYRLLVLHQGRVLADENYKTVRGARIAFTKMFGNKAWEAGVKADWSFFYPPETGWLNARIPSSL